MAVSSGKTPRAAALRARLRNLHDRVFDAEALVQSEQTPHQVIYEDDILRLRWYPPAQGTTPSKTHAVPLVLVAPLAVNMSIYDLFPERSLVRYLRDRGFALYLIDWGRPEASHDHWRLATYITEHMPAMLAQVRAHAGVTALSLHGWSLGGLFAYAYTAWSQDPQIRNLALIGAPCDYHDNGVLGRQSQRIGQAVRWLKQRRGVDARALPPRLFRSPGWFNSALYKMTSPIASVRPYLELLTQLDDREQVAAHATNAAFVDDMVAYPGGVIQDFLQALWGDNVLAHGRLPMDGDDSTLSAIHANLLLVAGTSDPVVTPSAARALLNWVSSRDQTVLEVDAGHMAILASRRAASEVWPVLADWLIARS